MASLYRLLLVDEKRTYRILPHLDVYGAKYDEEDPDLVSTHEFPDAEFDQFLLGNWLNIEQHNNTYWLDVAGVKIRVHVSEDGHPLSVHVDPPAAQNGCEYRLPITKRDVAEGGIFTRAGSASLVMSTYDHLPGER